MRFLKNIFPILFLFVLQSSFAQFTIDATLRPRFEYRHGYKTLFPNHVDPATFVSQRTRLNIGFADDDMKFYLSAQDVRVWGDVPQMNATDANGFSLHEAWGEFYMRPSICFKLGRQEIVYDDQRIFGNVDWAQQGRSHDAAIFKYEPETLKLHVGAAYNQEREALTGNLLHISTYKTLHYFWLHKEWELVNASFLFLNNGMQYLDEIDETKSKTRFSQTTGLHLNRRFSKFQVSSNLYYQFGKDVQDNSLSAYLLSFQVEYQHSKEWKFGLGSELLSGNDYGTPVDAKNKAFSPLYATGHKFNGFMDYFYVGNHFDSVGLIDVFATTSYSYNPRGTIFLNFHKFFAPSKIDYDISPDLGFEMDLVTSYSLSKFVKIGAGYSHYFPTRGIEAVKNNYDGNSNDWAWLMVTVNPKLFEWPD